MATNSSPESSRAADSGSLASRLVGSWELVDYRTTSDDGTVGYPLGEHVRGMLIYSADGFMSAQIMRADRAEFGGRNVHGGSVEERAEAAAGYLAYSGPYEVDEAASRVKHVVTESLFPNWVGSDQFRIASFDGDHLVLSSEPLVFRTTTLHPALTWRRAGRWIVY